jgi:hypothetical protein
MGMLRICSTDGCQVKTLGEHCLQHEPGSVVAIRAAVKAADGRGTRAEVSAREPVGAGVA